jgi:glyceraldehyde 3-phosphate dehydrogenase
MAIRVGINGFGRIGRCVARILENRPGVELVQINDLTDSQTLAHLYNYDSVHGKSQITATAKDGAIVMGGKNILVSAIPNPAEIPWARSAVDVVLECTGRFTKGDEISAHLRAGAKKVLLSAPGKAVDKTIVLGVNHNEYDPQKHHILSNGSCTTNCLAPVAHVVHQSFGIVKGLMTTIHSYTNDQRILDLPHSDLRRARAAALSMIPTSTGAAKAIGEVLPALAGKLNGIAVRVPTPNVSLVDVTFEVSKKTTAAEVNKVLEEASLGALKGILQFNTLPLVSTDFNGNPFSSIVDAEYTSVIGDNMVKILSWYDNEWGFSNRMVELVELIGKA